MIKRNWSREELIATLNLYLRLPFGKMHSRNPEVVYLARTINRTPSSIAMRLANFANIDPYHQNRGIKGLQGGRKQVEPIWQEFVKNKDDILFESEKILAEKESVSITEKYAHILVGTENLIGESKLREVKVRVNQNLFRQIVLENYSCSCAISGIDIPDLLVASHIIPWSQSEKERLNPENGICLSSLYDKAFDRGLIGINLDYTIRVSNKLKQNTLKPYYHQYFSHLEYKSISLPPRYYPKKEFIEFHLDSIFQK
ncbi:HNH endonuclease [Emticicia sp. ODNR4P]|nr:HNH endonuclease [Emticicia sp. ODNR4P]